MIRVGRKNGEEVPSLPNYKTILSLTKSSPYGELSPYVLKNENGHILENVWQFSKVYENVPYSKQTYSRYDGRIIWEWPSEKHYDTETKTLTDEYWKWREAGMNAKYPIRYPVGFSRRHECLFSVNEKGKKKSYISSRQTIYFPMYEKAVTKQPKFKKLKHMHESGENLLIVEVDGPHQESLSYYIEKYGVSDDFITNNTIEVTEKNMTIMISDTKHPFGHGYCLGMCLADLTV